MTDQEMLQELEIVLEACGIQVRHEMLDGFSGGLCTFKGRCCMFLDACTHPADLARLCAGALMRTIDIDAMYLKPEVRRYLEETAEAGCTGEQLKAG
jgi:hypothetical protein